MTKIEKIRDLHQFFIKKFRPKKPVILRLSKSMTNFGSYKYSNNKHYITINIKSNIDELYSHLYHEWAHLLEYHKWGAESHSDFWGKCFARTYRAYLEWLDIKYKV